MVDDAENQIVIIDNGSGMMKAGFALNVVGIIVVTLFSYYLAPLVF